MNVFINQCGSWCFTLAVCDCNTYVLQMGSNARTPMPHHEPRCFVKVVLGSLATHSNGIHSCWFVWPCLGEVTPGARVVSQYGLTRNELWEADAGAQDYFAMQSQRT